MRNVYTVGDSPRSCRYVCSGRVYCRHDLSRSWSTFVEKVSTVGMTYPIAGVTFAEVVSTVDMTYPVAFVENVSTVSMTYP